MTFNILDDKWDKPLAWVGHISFWFAMLLLASDGTFWLNKIGQ